MFAFLSALSFAVGNILVKKGMVEGQDQRNQGYFMTVISNVVILSLIFVIVVWVHDFTFHFSWPGTLFFILSGLFTTGLGRMTNFMAIPRIGPSRASAIKNSSPLFALLFAFFVLGESIRWGPACGMALVLIGILLQGVVYFKQQKPDKQGRHSTDRDISISYEAMGYLLIIFSAMMFGVGYGVRKQAMIFLNDAYYGAMVGAITSLVFITLYESIRKNFTSMVKNAFTTLNPYYLAAGVLTSFGPLFFFLGLSHTQVSFVSVISASEPLLTVILSTFFLKREEQLSSSIWVTVLLVLMGIVWIAFTT
jgi:drug/metabolite transporter (DMT)-like permease